MATIKFEPMTFMRAAREIIAVHFTSGITDAPLAVVFPGAGYSCKQPLLYYGIQVLLKNGFQVLAVDKVYGEDPQWRKLASEAEARRVVEMDSIALLTDVARRFPGGVHTLIGRSLGTYSIACAIEQDIVQPRQIVWQTPALGDKWALMRSSGIRSFGILGTADPYHAQAQPYLPEDQIVVEGADHAMEVPGDPVRSIEILGRVTQATCDWLAKGA